MVMMGLELDRNKRPRAVATAAERARQEQEQRLAEIVEEGERNYRTFLRRETPRCARYPYNAPTWRMIVVELGPRAEYWATLNAGLPYRFEDVDPRHPDGGRLRLEGAAECDGTCLAWPTRQVREAIQAGWLLYCGGYSGDAASWAANQGKETPRTYITAEMAGDALAASLTRQFIAATREAIQAAWRDREARRRGGSYLHVPANHWDAQLEAELQRQLRAYRRHPGHW